MRLFAVEAATAALPLIFSTALLFPCSQSLPQELLWKIFAVGGPSVTSLAALACKAWAAVAADP